jgi:ABC-type transporter Mla subunit MlaD
MRNRVIAGAFLLLALAAAMAILVVVGAWSLRRQPMQTLKIHFASAPNIKVGGSVLLAGHPVGRVEQIGLVEVAGKPGDKREKCYMVEVEASLPKTYRISQNARVVISQALVGQSAMLNIEDVGFGPDASGALEGNLASPFAGAAEALGLGPTVERINAILDDNRENLKTTSENLAEVSGNAKDTVERINAILDDNRENLKTASENLAEVSGNAKDTVERINAILDDNRENLKTAIANADDALASLGKAVDGATTTMNSVNQTFEKINKGEGTLGKLATDPELYRALTTLLENLQDVADNADRVLTVWRKQGILFGKEGK